MSNVADINTMRPHRSCAIKCGFCAWEWVAVYPENTKALECPLCHQWVNEFGTHVSKHVCATCGDQFTVCPAVPTNDGHKLPPSDPSKPAPPPEEECGHRKLSYCHGSSLWVCADCDERFNADEFSRLLLEPPEEGMTIKGDGASELGKLMREQRKGGPVPHA